MTGRYVPLFWRLFIPNATVLGLACVVLIVEPAGGRIPALVGGLTVMLLAHLVLMRRAVGPLERLTELMRRVDPLRPGQRIGMRAPRSEVSVLAEAFDAMLDRLEAERRDWARRTLAEREQERRRVSEALHDQIGQDLTAFSLQAARIAERVGPPVREEVADLRRGLLATVDDVRRIAHELRPDGFDALGLVPALTNLLERLESSTGVRVVRDLQRDLPVLTPNAGLVVYRVAQESCTNAIRHADASSIEVTLAVEDGRVVLVVVDDGVGIDPDAVSEGGIRTMRERAVLVGGELTIGPCPDRSGTRVRLAFDPVAA